MGYDEYVRPVYKRICPYCELEFESNRKNKKYCCYEHLFDTIRLVKCKEICRLTPEERLLRDKMFAIRKKELISKKGVNFQ